jgi:hypothetical protein
LKNNKHIQKFNEHQENLNISDVRSSENIKEDFDPMVGIEPNVNNKHSSDMNIKEQIEEILLTEYQYIDILTVQKLLGLFNVSKSACIHPVDKVWNYNGKRFCEKCNSWLEQVVR